jgi:hypothetical protein
MNDLIYVDIDFTRK